MKVKNTLVCNFFLKVFSDMFSKRTSSLISVHFLGEKWVLLLQKRETLKDLFISSLSGLKNWRNVLFIGYGKQCCKLPTSTLEIKY